MVCVTEPRMSALGTSVLVRRQQRHVCLLWLLLFLMGLLGPPCGRVDAAEATAANDVLNLDDSRLLLSSASSLPLRNNQEEPNNDRMESSLPLPETRTVVEANDMPSQSTDVLVADRSTITKESLSTLTCRNDDDEVTSATKTNPTTTIPAWAWFLVQCLQHVQQAWSLVLVPLYTIVVMVYLGLVTFRHSWHVRWGLPLPHFIKIHCTTATSSIPQSTPSDPTQQSLTAAVDATANATATAIDSSTVSSSFQPLAGPQSQTTSSHQNAPLTTTEPPQPINLTGSYQLVSSHNVDAFLAAQGVPWALRKLATSAVPIHHLHHAGSQLIIKIEAPSTGFATQSVYTVGGDAVETHVRGRLFRDAIRYLYNDDDIVNGSSSAATTAASTTPTNSSSPTTATRAVVGIVTEKHAVLEGYVVTVARRLSADGSRIDLTSVVSFPHSQPQKPSVVSSQVFERIK